MLVLFEELGRQTDGAIGIASDGAVRNGNLHRLPSGLVLKGIRRDATPTTLDVVKGRPGVLDPAPPAQSGEGGSGGWKWLVTARDTFEGELLRGMLEAAGVPVALDGFDRSPFAWMYPAGNVRVPVQVFVPAGLLDVARLELLEANFVTPDRLAASRAAAPARRLLRDRIRPVWLVVAILTALVVAWVIVIEILSFMPCVTHVFCV